MFIFALFSAAVVMAVADSPITPPHLAAVRTTKPPLIDGRLDDEAWRAAPGTEAFRQQAPFDGAAPSERMHLRVLYDETSVYIGVDCEQVHSPIVERLTRRDRDSESEWVTLIIDSRNDAKSAFMFAINVSGVQADGAIIDQTSFSVEWDENWEAMTERTATGWSAEIRIPLRTLRFDGSLPVQSWGFQAKRFIADLQETDIWAYHPREVASPISFIGRLDGLEDLKSGGALEIAPFALSDARRMDATGTMLGTGFSPGASAGLDLRWHVAQDLTFDVAVNPDFAQVEADQVILNLTNVEVSLPEKRRFFLEGIDTFSFPLPVFYSRRIGAAPVAPTFTNQGETLLLANVPQPATIYGAGKLVGRLGKDWTVGAMSALTASNDGMVFSQSGTGMPVVIAPATAFNALRIKRELGGGGHIGLIGTGTTPFEGTETYPDMACPSGAPAPAGTKCFHAAYVGGVDGRWRTPFSDYVLSGALIRSYIAGGPSTPVPELDGTSIGPGAGAFGGWVRVAKDGGKHLLWNAEYSGAGRLLQYNDLGYMARQNIHTLKAGLGWRTFEPGRFTYETTSALEVSYNRNLAGLDLGQLYELNTRLLLRNFWSTLLAVDLAPARFDDREVGTGLALERARYVGFRLELASDPRRLVTAMAANQTQFIEGGAYLTKAQGSLVLHALRQLDLELLPELTWAVGEYRYTHLGPAAATGPYYFGKLTAKSVSATLRANYTFTPRLTLQTYVQAFLAAGHFDDFLSFSSSGAVPSNETVSRTQLTMPAQPVPANPDFQDAAINVNVVFRWEYRLGSTIYFVYAHSQIPSVPPGTFATPATLTPDAFRHGGSSDAFLIKVSYWWPS